MRLLDYGAEHVNLLEIIRFAAVLQGELLLK